MAFEIDLTTFIEKATDAVDLIAEEIIRKRNRRSLLVLIDLLLFLACNPFQWPFANLLSLFPQLQQMRWYAPLFWSLSGAILLGAMITTVRRSKPAVPRELKLTAIRGLLPFGYDDAELFARLQREQILKECLQAISERDWRFGVLSGESGVGKTSFLQAGLWPELEKRKINCVYLKFSDLDPLETVRRALLKKLGIGDPQADGDLLSLFRSAGEGGQPIVLLFDQFEQFFVQRKGRGERAPFVEILREWYAEMESLPIKILISIRSDFLDHLNELQRVMKYSLSPTQSFRLERFEPEQATEILCSLAEQEKMAYDRKFISDMMRQELAEIEDGTVSPVEIQVLARMIERQTAQEGHTFDRKTFQRLGGVEGLMERYLTSTLATRETQGRRQAALKVLLALTDLGHNTRMGALSLASLRKKLGGELSEAESEEALSWLQLGDVRLITASREKEEERYELAHERMITALRRLAGKELGEAERAGQLLDRRTNEWLGSERQTRYLLRWREWRIIYKHRRYLTWGKEQQAKDELLSASLRRFELRLKALLLVAFLAALGWSAWNSNAWQLYLLKRELLDYSRNLTDTNALVEIARAFALAGEPRLSDEVAERISGFKLADKNIALNELVCFYVGLGEWKKDGSLVAKAGAIAERIAEDDAVFARITIADYYARHGAKEKALEFMAYAAELADKLPDAKRALDDYKTRALFWIAEYYLKFGDKENGKASLIKALESAKRLPADDDYIDERNKDENIERIIGSHLSLAERTKDVTLLSQAVEAAEAISDKGIRASAMSMIAQTYNRLGRKKDANELVSRMSGRTERIPHDHSGEEALRETALSYARLGEPGKASKLLAQKIELAERRGASEDAKREAIELIARGCTMEREVIDDSKLLARAIELALSQSDDSHKSNSLRMVVDCFAGVGDKEKRMELLAKALEAAGRIGGSERDNARYKIAQTYSQFGVQEKSQELLSRACETAGLLGDYASKMGALMEIAGSYAALGNKDKTNELMARAV